MNEKTGIGGGGESKEEIVSSSKPVSFSSSPFPSRHAVRTVDTRSVETSVGLALRARAMSMCMFEIDIKLIMSIYVHFLRILVHTLDKSFETVVKLALRARARCRSACRDRHKMSICVHFLRILVHTLDKSFESLESSPYAHARDVDLHAEIDILCRSPFIFYVSWYKVERPVKN